MKANVGSVDKGLRIVAGIAIIIWGIMAENWLGAIGVVPILTGVINFCPIYPLLGFNTKKS
jgi:membrane-associated protease RseP (regulator of RpoE activity)